MSLRLLPREEERAATARSVPVARRADSWPDAVAFREAVQNPASALTDPRLRNATFALDRRGLPLAYTGRFAVVFRAVLDDGTAWAVRCDTRPEASAGRRRARYDRLRTVLRGEGIAGLFAPFQYQEEGIRVGGQAYPVLTMPWVAGETLGRFVEKNRHDPTALLTLARTLGEARGRLFAAGVAHGDWQHDNLLVGEGGRRVAFVDYDGVYAPGLADLPTGESGHPNYQHPARSTADYGPDLDRFPCLLMQTALVALAVEPSLWDSFNDGESLVFRRADLEDPENSAAFATVRLVSHSAPELGALLRSLADACRTAAPPAPADPATFEKVAARLGVALYSPRLEPLPAPAATARARGGGVPLLEHEIEETEEERGISRRRFLQTVSISEEARKWIEGVRAGLKRQEVREQVNLWTARVFAATLFWLVNLSRWLGDDGLYRVLLGWFVFPVGAAILFFLWPRNLEGLAVEDATDQNNALMEINQARLTEISQRLHAINRDPKNLSAVAFVASALQAVPLEDFAVRGRAGLTAADLEQLRAAGITRLSDLPADLPVPLDPERRQALYAVKAETMDTARRAYDEISRLRRQLQQERDQLEAERQGLVDTDYELRRRAALMGSGSFGRYVFRVLGGNV
jgi:hypothetical protein